MLAKRPLRLAVTALALGGALAGCGSSTEPSIAVSGRLVGASATSPGQIVLSQLGAQRIGLETAATTAVPAPKPVTKTTVVGGVKHTTTTPAANPSAAVIVPYSSVIYDPSGKTYVFTNTATLTYTEVPITVDRISGDSAYLSVGPRAGTKVVSVGAEELYGVQAGVLAQT